MHEHLSCRTVSSLERLLTAKVFQLGVKCLSCPKTIFIMNRHAISTSSSSSSSSSASIPAHVRAPMPPAWPIRNLIGEIMSRERKERERKRYKDRETKKFTTRQGSPSGPGQVTLSLDACIVDVIKFSHSLTTQD